MNDILDTTKLDWQVEMVKDELQPAIDAYVMLRRTADAVSRHVENELGNWGMTSAQYGVLLHLMNFSEGEGLSLTELSGRVFRSNSALTSLIDRMERDDLVARAAHANDRRVKTVILTPKGRRLLLEIRTEHRQFLAEMMSCLTPEEHMHLCAMLLKMETHLERKNFQREIS